MKNTFFFTKNKYPKLFGFQKSSNTKYSILFDIEKIWIPNTKYYSVFIKYKCQIWIVVFRPIIWIPNTKYQVVHSMQYATKFNIFVSYKTFCFKKLWNYSDRYLDQYSNTRILFGVPKKPNTEYRILFGNEKILIPNTNTTIWSNYSNKIRRPNYSSHPGSPVLKNSF